MKYIDLLLKVDYSDDPRAVRIAAALWWYYASKLFELLGTRDPARQMGFVCGFSMGFRSVKQSELYNTKL